MLGSVIRVTPRGTKQRVSIQVSQIISFKGDEHGAVIHVRGLGVGADGSTTVVAMVEESEAQVRRLVDQAAAASAGA